MDSQLVAFMVVATLLTVTPGMDMALITRNVLRSGLRAGWATSAGVLTGVVGWAFLSALGVSAILAASAEAFAVLKLAGGVYLVYLGIATLWNARHRHTAMDDERRSPGSSNLRENFRQGLVRNLLNPRVGLFYTTLLPQFVSAGQPAVLWTGLLAAIHLIISIAWLAFFAWLVWQARKVASAPGPRRAIERVTGVVLIGLGARVMRQTT